MRTPTTYELATLRKAYVMLQDLQSISTDNLPSTSEDGRVMAAYDFAGDALFQVLNYRSSYLHCEASQEQIRLISERRKGGDE